MPEMRVEASTETLTLPSAVLTINVPGVAETTVPRMWAGGSAAIAVLTAVAATTSQKARASAFVAFEMAFIVVSLVTGNPRCWANEVPADEQGVRQHRRGCGTGLRSSSLWRKYARDLLARRATHGGSTT